MSAPPEHPAGRDDAATDRSAGLEPSARTDRDDQRFRRQFHALSRAAPPARNMLAVLLRPRFRWLRVPAAILLIVGGIAGILPILGFWMLPLGFMILAIDVPPLRAPIAAVIVRARRRLSLWRRKLGRGSRGKDGAHE